MNGTSNLQMVSAVLVMVQCAFQLLHDSSCNARPRAVDDSEDSSVPVFCIDEGGPTREFLAKFFFQLHAVTVPGKTKNFLFDTDNQTRSGVPQPDAYFHMYIAEGVKEQLELKFTAIGRVLLYTLRHGYQSKNSKIPILAIPQRALSRVYWYYLLRNVTPKDEKYLFDELYADVCSIFLSAGKSQSSTETRDSLKVRIDSWYDSEESVDKEKRKNTTKFAQKLRMFAHEKLIEERSIALNAIKKGMSLDGTFMWKLEAVPITIQSHLSYLRRAYKSLRVLPSNANGCYSINVFFFFGGHC
jgi:hypothetical protein